MYQDIVMQQPNPSYAQVLKEPPHRLTLPNVIDNVNLLQSSAQRAANQQRQRSKYKFYIGHSCERGLSLIAF